MWSSNPSDSGFIFESSSDDASDLSDPSANGSSGDGGRMILFELEIFLVIPVVLRALRSSNSSLSDKVVRCWSSWLIRWECTGSNIGTVGESPIGGESPGDILLGGCGKPLTTRSAYESCREAPLKLLLELLLEAIVAIETDGLRAEFRTGELRIGTVRGCRSARSCGIDGRLIQLATYFLAPSRVESVSFALVPGCGLSIVSRSGMSDTAKRANAPVWVGGGRAHRAGGAL